MLMQTALKPAHAGLEEAAEAACRAIPPLWPLSSSVAVNPFLGQAHESLADAAARLARVSGAPATMPRAWYCAHIAAARIIDADLEAALARAPAQRAPASLAEFKQAIQMDAAATAPLPTVADLAAKLSGVDWPGVVADRFGAWASSYFDQGQALWAAPKDRGAYAAWRAFATRDLTPEILGLSGFARHVDHLPEHPAAALTVMVDGLGLPEAALETYFHALLMRLGGYGQYARHISFKAEITGDVDLTLRDLLIVRLAFDHALFEIYGAQLADDWRAACAAHAREIEPTRDQILDAVLQDAFDLAAQRELIASMAAGSSPGAARRPLLQAAFCIDVRSEVVRRALESLSPDVETIGFAGFFGLSLSHRAFASEVEEARCPVLLAPSVHSCSGDHAHDAQASDTRIAARASRAWGRFKLAAVSSFAFVEATGPIYAAKLARDALAGARNKRRNDPAPQFDKALTPAAKVDAAAAILRAMSLTENFARIVLLCGHGANVANNPHASALDCGACGGYSGEANARLLALLLNDGDIRTALKQRDIVIPDDTIFIPALHDTTRDEIELYDLAVAMPAHAQDLADARKILKKAGAMARAERALRLPGANGEKDIALRSRNWAETRPEWGLAGCKTFIAAPRARTAAMTLDGRSFLHSYDWRHDENFGVLELIMTAPVVVASWISLQYYGSTVAPEQFGGGNKLLHNVVGGIGVVEGNAGLLRPGLPWQSVHDGEAFMHEPLRLSVVIEAPLEAMSQVLLKHANVSALFDNSWLFLFAMNEQGAITHRYSGHGEWQEIARENDERPKLMCA